jgi:ABC-type transport system substrate-binding protein
MQMAINLQDIATNYYLGTVDPQPQTLTSEDLTGWGFPYSQWPQDLKDQYAYNPPAAKQLLADAGYPTGFTTDVVSQDIADQSLLLIVKDELAAVNVTMNIRVMDSVSWINLVQVQKKYDQLAYKTTGRLGLDYPIMDGLPVFLTGASGNWCMVSDPIYDAAYAKAIAVSSTINDIKQAAIDINKEVAEQHFAITLLEPKLYGVSQPWLHGYRAQYNAISGGGQVGLSQAFFLARWWVDPGQ